MTKNNNNNNKNKNKNNNNNNNSNKDSMSAKNNNNDCLSLHQLVPATAWHGLLLKSETCGRRCGKRAAHKSECDCCLAVVVGSFYCSGVPSWTIR